MSQTEHNIPMERFYGFFGTSRQRFHSYLFQQEREKVMMEQVELKVAFYRDNIDARAGSRSLFYNLYIKEEYKIGVNKFEQLMSKYGLTLPKLEKRIITTNSCFQSFTYKNLTNGLKIDNINQLVVGDISYITRVPRPFYLFCLTDVYSAYIVGFHIGTRMRKEEAIKTLRMWIALRSEKQLAGCIHHTDGGGQYFAELYKEIIDNLGIRTSRAEKCIENGYAEQRNSILKNHLLPLCQSSEIDELWHELKEKVNYYNVVRKQEKLNWLSPVEYEREIINQRIREVKILHNFNSEKEEKESFLRHKTPKNS